VVVYRSFSFRFSEINASLAQFHAFLYEDCMTLMNQLLIHAKTAASLGEVPVAACVSGPDGTILALAHNEVELRRDATAHAEILAMRAAMEKLGSKYLEACTLTVTLEPCAMCAAAASLAKIGKIVYGAYDPKSGAVEHGPRYFQQATCHHAPEVIGGVMERECGQLLTDFFKARR
jgi:tRNA(adenine34) deaminase